MHYGEKIKLVRKSLNLTQKDLSKKSGIHYTMICKYEKGDVLPSIEAVKKIADALEVSLDYLMYDEKKESPTQRIHDRELLSLFEKIDKDLDERGKFLVKELLDAIIKKQSLEKIMS